MHKSHVFLLGLVISLFSEWIGKQALPIGTISITILPMLYAVTLGLAMSPSFLGKYISGLRTILSEENIALASKLAGFGLLILGVRLGFSIGPQVDAIFSVGWAFIAQEFGHLFAPIIAMPIALLLGLKRESIGCATSICREGAVGVISEKYGVNSPEGRSVLGVYIIGSVLGTVIFSIIGALAMYSGLHPYALAMACGVGSASMMAASVTTLAETVPPEMRETVITYAATSNLVSSSLTGIYLLIFATLPFSNWYYAKLYPFFHKKASKGGNHE